MAIKANAKKVFNPGAEGERLAGGLPDLDLMARNLANLIAGERQRNAKGQGMGFHSFDPYQRMVHDPRKIDFRASAKTQNRQGRDQLVIRQYEQENSNMVYAWVDRSKSMQYKAPAGLLPAAQQPRYTKEEKAIIFAGAIGYLTVRNRERFTLLGSDIPLIGNKQGVERIMQQLTMKNSTLGHDGIPNAPLHRGKPLGTNTHLFIESDFLYPMEEIKRMIDTLYSGGVKVHLLQILDPTEINFPYKGHIKFNDVESSFSHTLKKAQTAKEDVEKLVKDHIRDINALVQRIPGWSFHTYITNRPDHDALLPLYGISTERPLGLSPV